LIFWVAAIFLIPVASQLRVVPGRGKGEGEVPTRDSEHAEC